MLSNGVVMINYVKSKDNIAHPLLERLPKEQVNYQGGGPRTYYITTVAILDSKPGQLEIPRSSFKRPTKWWWINFAKALGILNSYLSLW